MSWSKLLVVALLAYGAFHYRTRLFGAAPKGSFVDIEGRAHPMKPGKKARAVGYWFEGCPESESVISVLNGLGDKHRADTLEIVAFYINVASDADIAAHARNEGVRVPVAAAQRTPEQFEQLNQSFPVQGSTVYIIDPKGDTHTITIEESREDVAIAQAESYLK